MSFLELLISDIYRVGVPRPGYNRTVICQFALRWQRDELFVIAERTTNHQYDGSIITVANDQQRVVVQMPTFEDVYHIQAQHRR